MVKKEQNCNWQVLVRRELLLSAYGEAHDIYHELHAQYTKSHKSGGFELLRVPEGGKKLDVIAVSDAGYTVTYLKAVVHHAKIYTRPL